jgi:membrane associated rhomboid family serine protease
MFLRPTSTIPMVGASGAISGVMGAYIVLYPFVRVHMFVFLFVIITTFRIPAWVMLGYWFLVQVLGGLPSLGRETGGTAFWAHVGGFAAGALLILLFQNRELVAQHRAILRRHYHGVR